MMLLSLLICVFCLTQIPDDVAYTTGFIIFNGFMVYLVNNGSKTVSLLSMVADTMLCSQTQMPYKECFEASLFALVSLCLIFIHQSTTDQPSKPVKEVCNQAKLNQVFNLLGREETGIIAMTYDEKHLKVLYRNKQMSLFES